MADNEGLTPEEEASINAALDDYIAYERNQDTNNTSRRPRWPRLPGHDAELHAIRSYLTEAAYLPPGWAVESADRHGRYGSDPLTITIRTPGQQRNIVVRFDSQRECSKPSGLRAAFFEATNGASRMKHPSTAQAGDFYGMVCALARVANEATVADETIAWLNEYLGLAWIIEDLTFAPDHRYDTLAALQARSEFTRRQAQRYLREELDPLERWVAIVDQATGELWMRAGELATYLRHVYGVGAMAMHTLDARIAEIGGDRVFADEDRRARGGRHMSLVLYRFPTAQAFPAVTRESNVS